MTTIRNARKDDVAALAEIGLLAWEQAVTGVADLEALRGNARTAFLQFLAANWVTVTVAESGGHVAGWAARERMDEEITDLWVEPSAQRQGVGTALLAALEHEMRRAGHEAAGLQTHARNAPALAFFGKHGYSINWLSVTYSPRLDRDVESVGMRRQFVEDQGSGYGPGGF
ncbi:GNAT family N-acetyltransferase [Mycoplana dimorpha]|uniref:Ribosomal-protein-alanine N-acetyltransferase n=1 Tax=Mycoplana dimorpha TaxID=28320 RepID=A0A2T5BIU0_MYCDI|nr:GNAT family N-acetyltransferase [Mycoplana dimorpha]PTM98909.1 ribosomal-protein-alanine N-acetyltransferase [Mycoplana dimorpha]